jgi:hypothetical protein
MKASGLAALAITFSAGVLAYTRLVRPRVLDWGADPDEALRSIPGDDILPDANLQTTRAITIDAPPDAVWPWLVQMGPRPRAGAYTYDWIERLLGIDIESSDRILPEYQCLEPGDALGLNKKGEGIRVRRVDHGRFLVLQWVPAQSTWTFGLYPHGGGRTRLVSRNRLRVKGLLSRLFMFVFMEPGSLIMERKMLLGIKVRAERLHRERSAPAPRGRVP